MSEEFWIVLGTAIGLLLVIEGLIYALFPGGMQRVMTVAMNHPPSFLRRVGTAALMIGIALVWLLHG